MSRKSEEPEVWKIVGHGDSFLRMDSRTGETWILKNTELKWIKIKEEAQK